MEELPDELLEGEEVYEKSRKRMQAHIDAEAELRNGGDGEPTPAEVVERAGEMGVKPYSDNYLTKIRGGSAGTSLSAEDYMKAIRYRETKQANDHVSRSIGNVSYEGPPLDMTMQHITERPITEIAEVNRVNGTTIAVTFELEPDDVFKLIREADEDDAKAMFDAVAGLDD